METQELVLSEAFRRSGKLDGIGAHWLLPDCMGLAVTLPRADLTGTSCILVPHFIQVLLLIRVEVLRKLAHRGLLETRPKADRKCARKTL